METIKLKISESIKAEFKKDIKSLVIKNVLNLLSKGEQFEGYEILFNNQYIKPKTGADYSREEFFQEKALFYAGLADNFLSFSEVDAVTSIDGEVEVEYNKLLKEHSLSSLTVIKINDKYIFLKPITRELYIKSFNKMNTDLVGTWEQIYNELVVGEKMDTSTIEFLSAYSILNYILVTKGNVIKKK